MNDRARFLTDLNMLGKAMRIEIDAQLRDLYWREVGEVLTDNEWCAAVKRCIQSERMLSVAGLLKGYNEQRDLALRIEATKAYEHVARLARYGQGGAYWNEKDVLVTLGVDAAKAFAACGGSAAFENRSERDEPFVRRAFVEWYVVAAKARDGVPMLPAPSLPGA